MLTWQLNKDLFVSRLLVIHLDTVAFVTLAEFNLAIRAFLDQIASLETGLLALLQQILISDIEKLNGENEKLKQGFTFSLFFCVNHRRNQS
jgi:hypothetical protein